MSTSLYEGLLLQTECQSKKLVKTHWGRAKMTDIVQTFSNVFCWLKAIDFDWTFAETRDTPLSKPMRA